LKQQQPLAACGYGECNLRNKLARFRHALPHVVQELRVPV
jgi:hypothetical protein